MRSLLFVGIATGVVGLAPLTQGATATLLVNEATFTTLTGQADTAPAEIAVDATGRILVIDQNEVGNDRLIRFDANGTNGTLIQTEDNIVTAIEGVNGTAVCTDFSVDGISVASDGDIILTNGDASGADSVVAVANAALGAITVLDTSVNATPCPTEGINRSTIIGNTLYLALNGAFGAAQDSIVSIDTNGAGAPAIATTLVTNETALTTVFGVTAANLVISTIEPGGAGLIIGDSGAAGSSDSVANLTLPGGAVALYVAKSDIIADIGDTDIGFSSMAVDGNGDLWIANNFGGVVSDDGVIKMVGPGGGTAASHLLTEAQIVTDLGGTEAGPGGGTDGITYQPSTGLILVTNSPTTNGAAEGIFTIASGTLPVELSTFSAD